MGNSKQFERTMTYLVWVIFACLFVEDQVALYFNEQSFLKSPLLLLQLVIILLFAIYSVVKLKKLLENESKFVWSVGKTFELLLVLAFVNTMYHSPYYYFLVLLPIAYISLSKGFRVSFFFIIGSFVAQLVFYFLNSGSQGFRLDGQAYTGLLIIFLQYSLFTVFTYIWGMAHRQYERSEEENHNLVSRLGDKYVQLELAKKEQQNQYEKAKETNLQLEESNRRLTASLAEFYTIQQISQAIGSIFNMYELLKYVNDVMIGVMGVSNSTIALCHGPLNKLKVQVSSIYDKKELSIISDFINADVLKKAVDDGHALVDNSVDVDEYPFIRGRHVQSVVCMPLAAKTEPLGVVIIEHSIPDAFDSENVRLLEVITQQVSVAIDNARLYQKMQDLATLDGLTGAYNRIFFQNRIKEEIQQSQIKGYDLSLIIYDIDHFKRFNDSFGHMFGDHVLKTLASYIKENLRKEDIHARYGGEEFVVLMPHTTIEQAVEKAEELRAGIERLIVSDRVITASVTVSMGVSTFPLKAHSEAELIKSADDALYEAKRNGRNCVKVNFAGSMSNMEPLN